MYESMLSVLFAMVNFITWLWRWQGSVVVDCFTVCIFSLPHPYMRIIHLCPLPGRRLTPGMSGSRIPTAAVMPGSRDHHRQCRGLSMPTEGVTGHRNTAAATPIPTTLLARGAQLQGQERGFHPTPAFQIARSASDWQNQTHTQSPFAVSTEQATNCSRLTFHHTLSSPSLPLFEASFIVKYNKSTESTQTKVSSSMIDRSNPHAHRPAQSQNVSAQTPLFLPPALPAPFLLSDSKPDLYGHHLVVYKKFFFASLTCIPKYYGLILPIFELYIKGLMQYYIFASLLSLVRLNTPVALTVTLLHSTPPHEL